MATKIQFVYLRVSRPNTGTGANIFTPPPFERELRDLFSLSFSPKKEYVNTYKAKCMYYDEVQKRVSILWWKKKERKEERKVRPRNLRPIGCDPL